MAHRARLAFASAALAFEHQFLDLGCAGIRKPDLLTLDCEPALFQHADGPTLSLALVFWAPAVKHAVVTPTVVHAQNTNGGEDDAIVVSRSFS